MATPAQTLRLPSRADSVALGRTWIRGRTAEMGAPEDTIETAALLTSELVTNAILHGTTCDVVTLSAHRSAADRVRVTVHDDDQRMPEVHSTPGDDDVGGRGLFLVQALTVDWGVDRHPGDGKSVWFALELPDGDAGAR